MIDPNERETWRPSIMQSIFVRPNCTYPMHVEPKKIDGVLTHFVLAKNDGCHWCDACNALQDERYVCAKRPPGYLYQVQWKILSYRFGRRQAMTVWANRHAPEGWKWCSWGLHYYDLSRRFEKTQFRHEKSECPHCYTWGVCRNKRIKNNNRLRKERTKLKNEILELQRQFKTLTGLNHEYHQMIEKKQQLLDSLELDLADAEVDLERV